MERDISPWFSSAGHDASSVSFAPLPRYVSFTDWAEDAFVALTDKDEHGAYLMEPWEFPRSGDALIADAVEEYTDVRASQAPLIFQGGNCLVGDDFWFLGKDYFADSVNLVTQGINGAWPPVELPDKQDSFTFVHDLFNEYVEAERRLIVLGTKKPIPVRAYYGTREDSSFYLDSHGTGGGTYQPIFHIDMFVTLIGRAENGAFEVLVGSPDLADELLGTKSPLSLNRTYDAIAADLMSLGFSVKRNPLVHWPTTEAEIPFGVLKKMSYDPDNEELISAVSELEAAGATESSPIMTRRWHHITWNNCLVENSGSALGKHVYLPTFGHGVRQDLSLVDDHMKSLWEDHGFTVHMLADFNAFAERLGVVHCIKKFLKRGL